MRSSSYFKTISRHLWIVSICLFGISCMTDVIGAIHGVYHGKTQNYKGPDIVEGMKHCVSQCDSDLKNCMYLTDGRECESDKNICDKECLDWSAQSGAYSKYAEDTKNKIHCYSYCNSDYRSCIDGNKGIASELQCEETKRTCFFECSPEINMKERKWCLRTGPNEWVPCEGLQQ